MIFVEYHDLKEKYRNAKQDYENSLEEKVKLFYNTQPGSVQPKDIVHHISSTSDKYVNYCADIEIVEYEVEKTRNILGVREYQLKLKEKELRESKDLNDQLYVMYFIENKKVKHIAKKVSYTREYTYDLIKKIKDLLNSTLI